ncbi:M15 family metallopeptidase [Candidatus Falkowbacteria bacterium]|nr:M15 family metallopeptidase [Candidatus Falkowbacteria bacterium]
MSLAATPGCCIFKAQCEDMPESWTSTDQLKCASKGGDFQKKNCSDIATCQKAGTDKATAPLSAPVLEAPLPGLTLSSNVPIVEESGAKYYEIPWIAEFIGALYKFGMTAVGVLAVIMIMVGGFIWLTAGGNQENIGTAKGYITGAIIGLIIALGSYTVLKIVNPALVNLKPIKILYVAYEPLDITPGNETSEPIATSSVDQASIATTYGVCDSVKLAKVDFPTSNGYLMINEKVADSLRQVAAKINASGLGGYKLINGGTFNCRPNVNNPKKMSLHSYGLAIDFNPSTNPNKKPKPAGVCPHDLPDAVMNAFKSTAGWRWGGDFKSVCDAMHFEYIGQ